MFFSYSLFGRPSLNNTKWHPRIFPLHSAPIKILTFKCQQYPQYIHIYIYTFYLVHMEQALRVINHIKLRISGQVLAAGWPTIGLVSQSVSQSVSHNHLGVNDLSHSKTT